MTLEELSDLVVKLDRKLLRRLPDDGIVYFLLIGDARTGDVAYRAHGDRRVFAWALRRLADELEKGST